ncbi:MAG: sulfite exporter TauE/SafE family protein [Candidatus Omnitrophota bacterium]
MVKDWWASFGLGFATGTGGCLLFCAPVLASYLVATKTSLKDKVIATLLFSFWKTLPYLVLGYLAGEIGQNVITTIKNPNLNHGLKIGTGFLLIVLSVLIMVGKFSRHRFCRVWEKHLARRQEPGIMALGLIFGLLPCVPLLSLLTYIAFMVKDPWLGMVCTLFFSLGNAIPLLLVGTVTGVGSLSFRYAKVDSFLRLTGGGIILIWGIRMML